MIEALLRDLQASPTDLRRLVVSALSRTDLDLAVMEEAIARWERDDPRRWASVQEWLLARGNAIVILKSARSALKSDGTGRAPQRTEINTQSNPTDDLTGDRPVID